MASNAIRRARMDEKECKAPSTQAGEFVREEIEHVREGVHGARNTKQAIAIALSKARRAGVQLPPPKKATVSAKVRRQAERDAQKGAARKPVRPSRTRSRAVLQALQHEGRGSASRSQLSRQARARARRRGCLPASALRLTATQRGARAGALPAGLRLNDGVGTCSNVQKSKGEILKLEVNEWIARVGSQDKGNG